MSAPSEQAEPQELALRSARKDNRELVRMRYVEETGTYLVECEVYPIGGLRVEPLRPGPYRFGTRDDADTFIRETVTILEYLGCDVT
jgi:5-carboxymethyl-2-hydroxymuconate isomerase